ncbi:glycosyltransferase [Luteimonas sp. A478]
MRLSIIIPAHDEAPLIGATLDSLARSTDWLGDGVEIIVVDDASSDGTGAIARARGARVLRVEARQIAAARNAGAAVARGERLLFVDADTLANPEVVTALMAAMDRGAAGGGVAVRFMRPLPLHMRIFESVSILLFRLARVTPGCFLFCTRRAFDTVGGFDEGLYVTEDVRFGRALRRVGRVVILREEVCSSARKMHTYSFGEKLRFMLRFLLAPRRVSRDRERLELWYGPRRHEDPEPGKPRKTD